MPTSFTKKHHHVPYPFISPARPAISAAGKNVVVTGGGTGIGKAIATAFAQAGAKSVSIIGRRENVLRSAAEDIAQAAADLHHQTQVLTQVADLTSYRETLAAATAIRNQVGPVDIFVSNAGTLTQWKPTADQDAASMTQAFELNCITTLHSIQAFMAVATTSAPPILINISSIAVTASPRGGPPKWSVVAYSSTKAASLKMVHHFAAENPSFHVFSVHPGLVWSEMTEKAFPREACPDDGASLVSLPVYGDGKLINMGQLTWLATSAHGLPRRKPSSSRTSLCT